jgi:hypothetical protein
MERDYPRTRLPTEGPLYSAIAEEQLDALEGADPDRYNDVLTMITHLDEAADVT